MKKLFTMALVLGTFTAANAQESLLNVLRSDVRTQVSALIEIGMEFSDQEAEVFWPVYREYELKVSKLYDETIEIIKDYAEHYDSMTDEKADELVKRAQENEKNRLELSQDHLKNVRAVLSGVRAARYYQVHRQILGLVNLQIQSELPLVHEPIEMSGSESGELE